MLNKEKKKIEGLKSDYYRKKEIYDSLVDEIQLLKDDLDYIAHGLYEPHFDFDTSEQFKEQIKNIRLKQKTLVRNKGAVIVHSLWEISGSKVEGRK